MNYCVVLLLVLACAGKNFSTSTTLCLYQEQNLCTACTETYTSISDITLPSGNFAIVFCSEDFQLKADTVFNISNKHSVIIKGKPTQLICNGLNTGVHIYEVTDLTIQDIELVMCGAEFNGPSYQIEVDFVFLFKSSIHIENCTDIVVERLTVTTNYGNGITMFDNDGTVKILDSTFHQREDDLSDSGKATTGGSGLHIELSYCGSRSLSVKHQCRLGKNIETSCYQVLGCTFFKNTATNSSYRVSGNVSKEHKLLTEGFGRGGGISIIMDKNSSANIIEVINCNFTENSAIWGGALYIVIQEMSRGNVVYFEKCVFYNNSCTENAGGGVDMGFVAYKDNHPKNNSLIFQSCDFIKNQASLGGGVSLYSSQNGEQFNRVIFVDSIWTENSANFGAAVDISPQIHYLHISDLRTEISFVDCTFESNYIINDTSQYSSYEKGKGIFLAVGFHILFEGNLRFADNRDSALYLISTEVEFASNSVIEFTNNNAFEGGAVYMLGFSAITLNENLEVTFKDNFALSAGGAIYQHIEDKRDFSSPESCFLNRKGRRISPESNISFHFENNTASQYGRNSLELGLYGHSIYITTITPCYKSRHCMTETYKDVFNGCFGNFTFEDENRYDISTPGSVIRLKARNLELNIVPGKLLELPIETLNDMSEEVSAIYQVSLEKPRSSTLSIDPAYSYISKKVIRVYGKPGEKASLILKTTGIRELVLALDFTTQECPPGFSYREEERICICSVTTNKRFLMHSCDSRQFEAQLIQGFWMGYDTKESENGEFGQEKDLLYAICPLGQCLRRNDKQNDSHILELPKDTNISALEAIVCTEHRTGILCSKCASGYASNYHSDTNECKPTDCRWGWLLYIASEIIPVTVFFVIVMVLSINFTDGRINGFILFVQISDTMLIRGNGFIHFPRYASIGLEVYRFVTRIYNLSFFRANSLSYCLWKTATTLDLLAFKYITILYASTLVLIIIVVFRCCHSKKINTILVKIKAGSATSTKSTIIHGISGFLVICYSECTRISLLLLTPVGLYAINGTEYKLKRQVAFYDGDLEFFHNRHLLYALPALAILLVIGILPILSLISYPLCYKVLSLLRLNETTLNKILCTCIPLEKLKPFFDSFQSSYKDDYRFFSGLYFLYRFTTLATFAFVNDLTTFYALVQVQFVIILAVHAICQPYKQPWHNILDALLFLNLSMINAISLSNFYFTSSLRNDYLQINMLSTFQVILLYLPLAYVIVYVARNALIAAKKHTKSILSCQHFICGKYTSCESDDQSSELTSTLSLNAAEDRHKYM